MSNTLLNSLTVASADVITAARSLEQNYNDAMLKIGAVDEFTKKSFLMQWTDNVKQYVTTLRETETDASVLCGALNTYVAILPQDSKELSEVDDVIADVSEFSGMAAPYCDKDTTDAMAALVEKFQGLGERIDTAVQARQTSIKEQVDEVKEEIAVLQEEREKIINHKKEDEKSPIDAPEGVPADSNRGRAAAALVEFLASLTKGHKTDKEKLRVIDEKIRDAQSRLTILTTAQKAGGRLDLREITTTVDRFCTKLPTQPDLFKRIINDVASQLKNEVEAFVAALENSKDGTPASQSELYAKHKAVLEASGKWTKISQKLNEYAKTQK